MSRKKIVIIGAGGHGRVVADIARLSGYSEILFLDDNPENKYCKVVGKTADYIKFDKDYDFFVAIGNNGTRRKICERLNSSGIETVTLSHPSAIICQDVKIGKGTVVMAGAVINTNAILGEGVIINTSSSVDHDCVVGDFSHIAVGAHLAGTVEIGNNVFIGAGATIINDVTVCKDCIIGAGSVIVRNLTKSGTYYGVPAKLK